MNKQLQNKLKAYSALTAAATLSTAAADAQMTTRTIGYTGGYETYDIDIDDNNTVDFQIDGTAFGTYGIGLIGGLIYLRGQNGGYLGGTYSGGAGGLYPLAAGEKIGFYGSVGFQASKFMGGGYSFYVSSSYYGSDTFGALSGTTDTYVAVTFNRDGNYHLGWMRFTNMAPSLQSWTLAEVGFDAQPMTAAFTDSSYPERYATTTLTDIANNGNPSDLQVRLQGTTSHEYFSEVSNYKMVLAKDDGREWGFFDVLGAMGADFTEDGSGIDSTINLEPWSYDSDGDLILQNMPYNVYTITWDADGNPLRMSVDPITLNPALGVTEVSNNVAITAANNTLNVSSDKAFNNAKLRVFDLTGKVVLESTLNGNNYSANVNEAAGIYIVHILTSEGVITKKIVL